MNPAERYAALKLLEHALRSAITAAAKDAEDYAVEVRAKSLETDYGTVGVTRRKPAVTVDEAALLEWATKHRPDVIRPSLDPLFVQAMRAKLVADGDDAVDPETGEAVSWASVRPGAEYLWTRLSAESKAEAERYVSEHVGALVAASLPKAVQS